MPSYRTLFLLVFSVLHAQAQPVRTESGLVSGTRLPPITVFKGIPYAAPPTGLNRWQPPEPPPKWTGIRSATQFGPSCAQYIEADRQPWTHEFRAHGQVSEDCLFLNIWTPAANANAKLPVLVFLHGGSNVTGSGSIDVLSGEGLARRGVVMVTLNYRLGILGFLTHPDLTAESPRHVSGNYGLLDQIAALQWLRRNISAFGGDPSRITLAGQSAGAFDISCLILSPLAKGLFQRAIMESGGNPTSSDVPDLATSEAAGAKLPLSPAQMRTTSWKQLLAIRFHSGPVIDGYVIDAGTQNDIPILAGTNAGENSGVYWASERAKGSTSHVYLYYFNRVLPGPESARWGAFHAAELPYVLNNLAKSDRPFTPVDRKVADTLSSYWINFATNADPDGPGLPHWPSAQEQPGTLMQLGANSHPK
jgi:para-nitrobenzyl esterase